MKIKKLLLPILFISVFAACQKDDNNAVSPDSQADSKVLTHSLPLPATPTTFSQKLLMELYTTVSCATCPDSEQKYRNYAAAHPDKIYGASIHTGDAMDCPQFAVLSNLLTVSQFSSGSFNRIPYNGSAVLHKTTWAASNLVTSCLNKTAKCGLKINSSFTGNLLNTTVTAGFGQSMTGNYNITVYLIENGVTGTGSGYNQANYYNNTVGSQWYQLGSPIVGYIHDNVLRKVATPGIGTPIAASFIHPGGSFSSTYTIDATGYNKNNLYVIAFVNKVGTTGTTHEIMNVQQVKAGQNKSWD